ncbi:MAG: hydrogenase small subunit [Pseudomonadota bacterium]
MNISRRSFLKYCGTASAALGLNAMDLLRLENVLADPKGPTVLWLQGCGCTGCSISFLNRVSASAPATAADLLINSISLAYHPNLMSCAGDSAVDLIKDARAAGKYILAVEGGVPAAFNGFACTAWTDSMGEVTFQQAIKELAARASSILCIGTCASWGGIPAAPPNPAMIKSVKAATGKSTINIAGCPPHPDWIVWTMAQLLLGKRITLDKFGRPRTLYKKTVHERCPREDNDEAQTYGVDKLCLEELGCRGHDARCNAPRDLWNNRSGWCCDANALCLGCTEPAFPGAGAFHKMGEGSEEDEESFFHDDDD